MDDAKLEHFRRRLLEMQGELQAIDADAADSRGTVHLDQQSVGRLSRMDAMQGQQMALETERRRKRQLALIAAALNRLEEGDYGYCLDCGEAIAPGRLEYDPATPRCVNCSD